jgi:sensor histidine kinase YesM
LRAPSHEEHALRDELAILDQYLDVMALRFGPRLSIERVIDGTTLDASVPWMVLQPLAENALEHGLWPRSGPGVLRIEAVRDGARLRLTVEDDGVGIRTDADDPPSNAAHAKEGAGIGLANTRRRLAHLYGSAATLAVEPREGGGTRATVVLPLRIWPRSASPRASGAPTSAMPGRPHPAEHVHG